MKHAILGASVALTLAVMPHAPVEALDVRHNAYLGAPLYAGPNVVIVQNGHRHKTSRYGRNGRVTIYHHPPPRHYGYGPRYGHRAPPRHYGYDRPRYRYGQPGYRYGRDPYTRHYPVYPRRERHPPPYVYGKPNPGPYYGTPPYGNPRYANPGKHQRGPRLTILGATYRSIDGRSCDAYSYAHRKCDGNQSCTVKASNSICGDPDRGRLKVLEVSYACGNRQFTSNTPERSRSKIRCR